MYFLGVSKKSEANSWKTILHWTFLFITMDNIHHGCVCECVCIVQKCRHHAYTLGALLSFLDINYRYITFPIYFSFGLGIVLKHHLRSNISVTQTSLLSLHIRSIGCVCVCAVIVSEGMTKFDISSIDRNEIYSRPFESDIHAVPCCSVLCDPLNAFAKTISIKIFWCHRRMARIDMRAQ